MKREKIKKTFEIEATEEVMERFEKLLAMFHFNSRWGHSALFGMYLDGDGDDMFTVKDIDEDRRYGVNAIGGVGYGVEVATSNGYTGTFTDRSKESRWYVKGNCLYKYGVLVSDYTGCEMADDEQED